MKREAMALAVALCLLLAGCGNAKAPDGAPSPSATPSDAPVLQEVRDFSLPLDPAGGWNPYVGSKSGNMTLAPLIYESLFQLDGSFAWHPLLAKSANVSEDGLVWTVELREGVAFSNGQSLDAEAVAAAVNAARGEKSAYATRLSGVRKVTAQDENTVVFELSAPNARFPALLDFPIALVGEEEVYGTGPYVVAEDKLTARAGWWRGLELPLAQMPLLEIKDADALVAAFNANQLSLAADDPTSDRALGYAGSYQSWEYPTSSMIYLGFQCGKGPCKNAGFRRAVSRAVDREGLVSRDLSGHATAATLPAPAASDLYEEETAKGLAYDLSDAAAALDELGYEAGEDGLRYDGRRALSLTLLVNADNVFKEAVARSVAADLEQLGIQVEVRALAWEEYTKALDKGDFDLYLAECRMTGDLDPSPYLTWGSGVYYGGFSSGELTQALADARRTGEWAQFYKLWAQEAPLAVLCFKNAQMLTQWGQVAGADPTQGNLFYQFENWQIG